MQFLAILLTVLCYVAAGYLWWREQSWNYLVALVAGHLAALLDPLWQLLYGFSFAPELATFATLLGRPLPTTVLISSAWYYTLPGLAVLYLYRNRWWFSGYTTALLTFGIFLLYHLLMQSLGTRLEIWSFTRSDALPLDIGPTLLSALLGALVSLMLLYLLLATHRYGLPSLLLVVLPSVLMASLLVHGVLGAPLWVPVLLEAQRWALTLGMLGTLGLVLWAIHIGASGITLADSRA
jgi:hypothetical protein